MSKQNIIKIDVVVLTIVTDENEKKKLYTVDSKGEINIYISLFWDFVISSENQLSQTVEIVRCLLLLEIIKLM